MISITKNKLGKEIIEKIIRKFYPHGTMTDYFELTEGYFNAAYEIHLNTGQKIVLKVAPDKNTRIMTYEKNIMQSETGAMEMVNRVSGIPAPKLLGKDMSCTICPYPYFLMEKLEGNSLHSVKQCLSKEEIQHIYYETGEIDRRINEIECPCFGYPGQIELQGKRWYDAFYKMMKAGIRDAQVGNVDLKIQIDDLWEKLKRDHSIFEEVKTPKLVHWDCWDGNIFVQDGKVTGIIDWERCLWADPLMEVGFRTYDKNPYFLSGYGVTGLTDNQLRRAIWYDIYFLILAASECEYRKYDSMEMYHWSTGLLQEQFKKVL